MSTPNITPSAKYSGNGVATEFAVPFPYLDKSYVSVYVKRGLATQVKLSSTDFDFTNDTYIIYPKAGSTDAILTSNDIIVIKRETPVKSDYVFDNQVRLFPEDVMNADDLSFQIIQEQADEINRAIKVSETSSANPDDIVPAIESIYSNLTQISAVENNIDDINTCASNITDIQNASTNAQTATTKASEASASATSAANSASQVQNATTDFVNITVPEAVVTVNNAVAVKVNEAENAADDAEQSALKAEVYAERVRSEGIPMSVIEQKREERNGNTAKLWWQDPRDTIIDGYVLASWQSTTIIKKQGGYPEDITDGEVVEIVTTRNKYLNNPLEDISASSNWFYRAFPLSVNGVYNLDKRNCFGVVLFGYRINETDPVPSTRVEYLPFCDNYFYDHCGMDFVSDTFNWGDWERAFFIPKPCALRLDGNVDYYLDRNNFDLKEDGSSSDVRSTAYGGNFMVEFPAVFMKIYKENNHINVLFSNVKLDDDFECWSCKKADGSYAENFYMPMFEGTNISNVLRSVATNTSPTGSTNAETEATLATANGTGWNTTTWADEMVAIWLYPLLFKSTDSQSTLGYGGSGSTTALTVNNDAAVTRGMMYGTSGASGTGMTYLGMHNYWGHRWRRPNGLMNANGNILVKMTNSTVDGSTVTGYNRTGSGYIPTGYRPPEASQSYINRYEPIGSGKLGIVPKATSGSSSTFYCDGMWTNNGQLNQLILGGTVDHGALAGVFCFNVTILPSYSYWSIGASLSYHHP